MVVVVHNRDNYYYLVMWHHQEVVFISYTILSALKPLNIADIYMFSITHKVVFIILKVLSQSNLMTIEV